ncbi:anhydro-N-acetylmuramic acid kinase [Limnohabitans sp. Rim8]|uniref:anhydro-N-acetylmuramic acid kinase n=1 Tax=Limnohabitans sp. Rim8 TaxID=1100718 RepID=UPI0025F6D9B5|nr:anhydro-N-acetylmuramic acid kinase [Limnohabitans sp. Rim8]
MPSSYFVGLMSGTSLDGVDGVLAQIDDAGRLNVLAHDFAPFDHAFRSDLLSLNQSGTDELHRSALAGNAIARHYAEVVDALLHRARLTAAQVKAIGAHGQTVRHRPLEFDPDVVRHLPAVGYTLQLINPALLAELTGIDVVADFRSRDLAAGGQGAPLVPAFHQGVFAQPRRCVAVLNIGGIANLSVLKADGSVLGWDCGPGNTLMDFWCARHTGQAFDRDGAWAASGQLHPELLLKMAGESFLHKPPPKSTGRDLFNPAWLLHHLAQFEELEPADVQATLCTYTAYACSQDLLRYAPDACQLVVCGGGALNGELIRQIAAHVPDKSVLNSEALGLPPLQVEAAAFAWLAFKTVRRETSSLPSVTGARGARVLGAIYPR